MSSDTKREKKLIAGFEEMLRDVEAISKKEVKPLSLSADTRVEFIKWLRPFVVHKLGTDYDGLVEAVNTNLTLAKDGSCGTVKLLVFSGVALPPLPTTFWIKNKAGPFLCESQVSTNWHQATVRILKRDDSDRELMSVPYFYKEINVRFVPVEESRRQIEFESAVMGVGDHEHHLKLLLCESVFNLSRQEEFKALLRLEDSRSISTHFKEQNTIKMNEWEQKLKQKTLDQASRVERFGVSDKDLLQQLLSQDQVNEILDHVLKKSS